MGECVHESARVVLEKERIGKRYKAGWLNFSLLSIPPTLPVRKANARPVFSGLDFAISGVLGVGDSKVAVPTPGSQRRTGLRVAIVA